MEEGGKALEAAGVDADDVSGLVDTTDPLSSLRREHERNGDSARARDQIERVIGLVTDFPELHKFKQADLPD